jgi:hypothetical protein
MADIFISNLPVVNEHKLRKELEPHMRMAKIHAFHAHIIRGKKAPCAIVTLPTQQLADLFVVCFGQLTRNATPRMQIQVKGRNVFVKHSDKPPRDAHLVKSLVEQQNRKTKDDEKQAPQVDNTSRDKDTKSFPVLGFQCGAWATETDNEHTTTFNSRYVLERSGTLNFRPQSVIIEFGPEANPESLRSAAARRCTLVMYYHSIGQICTDSQSEIFFTLYLAPRIYFSKKTSDPQTGERLSRDRVSGVEAEHEAFAGFSLVYKVTLQNQADHPKVVRLGKKAGVPPINPGTAVTEPASMDFIHAFTRLVGALQEHRLFPFRPAFQLNALVSNGTIPPETVIKLLPRVRMLISELGDIAAGEILRRFVQNDIGSTGSEILGTLEAYITKMRPILTPQYFEDEKNSHTNMAYIHRMTITPTGVFSYGPNWEASNRVLRQYSDYHDYFLRVSFCEEDGEQFQNEPRVNAERILVDQFLNRLDPARGGALVIAGRRFEFLGFSNSSLKSQTCWYMAPFEFEGKLLDAEIVVKSLGNFSEIRTPGRYAARVGQAFSDTIGSVLVDAENEVTIDDIERDDTTGKPRNFSDGIGKVSLKMVERIWKTSEKIGEAKPTVFQIRYAGAKGMIALDPALKGDKLCLRRSMIKFEGSKARNIELCSWASRLPMFLNRYTRFPFRRKSA